MSRCPRCGKQNTRPAIQSGIIDAILRAILLAPVRCRSCRARFYRFAAPGSKMSVRKTV